MHMTTTYIIRGMICKHCAARVQKAIEALAGVDSVTIDLDRSSATVDGEVAADAVMAAVTAAGYGIELAQC